MRTRRACELGVVFSLALACGAVVGDQGDLAALAFSAAMLLSFFWWGVR